MGHARKIIDTSRELCVYRYGDGLKLIRPDHNMKQKQMLLIHSTGYTVSDMLRLPFGVYFYNQHSVFQNINDKHAESCGFESENKAIGKTVLDTAMAKYATRLMNNNKTILTTGKMKILDEEIVHHDGAHNNGLSIKVPWYDEENNIIGILGCTIIAGKHAMADSLSRIAQLNLLRSVSLIPNLKNYYTYLTKREAEILYYLVKGKTAKQMGEFLCISHRTVEQYIEKIKFKMDVYSKSELIEKVMDKFI